MDDNETIGLRNRLRITLCAGRWLFNDVMQGRLDDAENVSRRFAGMCKTWNKQYKKQQSAAKRGLKHTK